MKVVLYPRPVKDVLEIGRRFLPDGLEMTVADPSDPAGLASSLSDAQFLIGFVGPLSEDAWRNASGLKLIQLLSAGYDNFQIAKARELGIPVATNGGANAIAVAEHTVMLMLAVLRRLSELDRGVRAGVWRPSQRGALQYHEIGGKKVGLVGMGQIGREVSKRLKGFDVDLRYHDVRRLSEEQEASIGVAYLALDELLSTSDVVSLHVPLLPETRGLIGARELRMMPRGAVLINTARGELVDEGALVAAVTSGHLGGAGLDVLSQEPPPADHPVFKLDSVVVTPHTAGPTWESWPRRYANGFANVERVARGEKPLWVIPELRDLVD